MDGDVFRDDDRGGETAGPDAGSGGGVQADSGAIEPGLDAAPDPDPPVDAGPGQPDAAPSECSDDCMMCGGGCCAETCGGGGDCRLTCNREGCDCTLDCAATDGTCDARCERGGSCAIDCSDVNDCRPRCRRGAACEIDCGGANNCDKVECRDGASCLLDCTGANNCEFDRCDGEQQSCAGGIMVCNRDCP